MEKQWFYIFTFQFSTKTDQYKIISIYSENWTTPSANIY